MLALVGRFHNEAMEFVDHSEFLILAKLALHQRRWQEPLVVEAIGRGEDGEGIQFE
jgi:hypothetical protein